MILLRQFIYVAFIIFTEKILKHGDVTFATKQKCFLAHVISTKLQGFIMKVFSHIFM